MEINYKQRFIHFKKGTVVLAGAGPGCKELITLKVYGALREADIIIYDALVNEELLNLSNKSSQHIFAGKVSKKKLVLKRILMNGWFIMQKKIKKY